MSRTNVCILVLGLIASVSLAAGPSPHCLPIIVEDLKLIKPEQLTPNATFHVGVPILGKSTHRTRGHASTVMMSVHLPSNYDPKTPHPVVIHLGGGVDQRKFIGRWTSITGNKDFIILLAEYTSMLTSGPRNAGQMLRILEAATPVKHGAVILAGISSGSWGMHGNFRDRFFDRGYVDPFDAFIFIAGDNEKDVIETKAKLRGRPVLLVGGNSGAALAIQKKTHESLLAEGADSTFIHMLHGYDDFSRDVDPKIMDWIRKKVMLRQEGIDSFDKKLASAKAPADYLALLKDPTPYWHGKTVAMTRYIELARKESDAGKRAQLLGALKPKTDLPKCNGGDYMEALKWLKTQPGMEPLVKELGMHNPFLDPVPNYTNGYAPNTNFNTR